MGHVNCGSAIGRHIKINVFCVYVCIRIGLCVSVMRPRSYRSFVCVHNNSFTVQHAIIK